MALDPLFQLDDPIPEPGKLILRVGRRRRKRALMVLFERGDTAAQPRQLIAQAGERGLELIFKVLHSELQHAKIEFALRFRHFPAPSPAIRRVFVPAGMRQAGTQYIPN